MFRSGQIIFERWTIGFYNVIFTALPPFAIGLFDKLCSPEIMIRVSIAYDVIQINNNTTKKAYEGPTRLALVQNVMTNSNFLIY